MTKFRRSRRDFINLTGAGVAGLMTVPLLGTTASAQTLRAAVAAAQDPDLIVINARVYTVDTSAPSAEAFAISGDKFSAVGSTIDIQSLAGPNTQTFDAQGMTVVPGFIDCHNHARGETLLYDVLVGNPFEVEFVSIDSIVDKLRAKAQTLSPDTWVEGYFFDDTKLSDARGLHRRDLDLVSSDHPVVVQHRGGHTSFYNSKAFEMAGITRDTPNPMGGTYDKDPEGQLNGRVTDRATAPMRGVGTRPSFSEAELAAAQTAVAAVHLAPALKDYIVRLVMATRAPDGGPLEGLIAHAVSPRGSLSLAASSRARAALHGRDHALPEDVAALATDALSHRLIPSWRATSDGQTARDIVAKLLAHVQPY